MSYEDIVTDANVLYRGLLSSVASSKWKESSQSCILSPLTTLFSLQQSLKDRTFRPGDGTVFTLHERGRVRRITSLNVKDRIVRHVLCDYIFMPLIKQRIIYDNGASVKERGLSFSKNRFDYHIKKYIREHGSNQGYILFGDFSKFYDNIDHSLAKSMLLDLVDNEEYISWLLDIIFEKFEINITGLSPEEIFDIEHGVFNKLAYIVPENQDPDKTIPKSVNIGDQLSQIIGIYYPHTIDNYVKIVRGEKYYGRYMDDWYIIHESKHHLIDMRDNIDIAAQELGLHINRNKTNIIPLTKKFMYLQTRYRATPTGELLKRINPKRVTAMRIRLKKLALKVQNDKVEYPEVENMFKSWMGNFYKIMSKEQIRKLFELYSELFDVNISIKDGTIITKGRTS